MNHTSWLDSILLHEHLLGSHHVCIVIIQADIKLWNFSSIAYTNYSVLALFLSKFWYNTIKNIVFHEKQKSQK